MHSLGFFMREHSLQPIFPLAFGVPFRTAIAENCEWGKILRILLSRCKVHSVKTSLQL